ncbi:Kettin [Dirofilaria immitis]
MPFKRPLGERIENLTLPNFIRPLQDKRVVVGQNVLLECQVDGHPDPVVKWLKDDHDVTQCPDYEISSNGIKHHLAIKNVQAADNGRFTVQAMNAAGIKQSICMLIVAPAPTPIPGAKSIANSPAPPQTPIGPSAPIFLKELKNSPLKLGSQIILEARVVGHPEPQVEWLKNGLSLNNYRAKTEYDTRTGICALIISQMFADDVGEYTCRATNAHGIAESSAQLMSRDAFEKWFYEQQSLITSEWKQAMLAQSQKQRPAESNRSISSTAFQQRQTVLQRPSTIMQRQGRQFAQNSSFDCDSIAEIPWGFSESETEAELASIDSRGFGGPPQIQTSLKRLRLTEGTDAILQCNITGNPKPNITWFKNGKVVDLFNSKGITAIFKGSLALLKISSVIPTDSGEYTLIAENYYGKVESKARVEVYPLHIPDEQRSLQSEQFQKFYPVDSSNEQPDRLQQKRQQQWEEKNQRQQQPIRHLPEKAHYAEPAISQQTYSQPKVYYAQYTRPEYEQRNLQSTHQPYQIYQQQFYKDPFQVQQPQLEQQYRDKFKEHRLLLPRPTYQLPSPAQLNSQLQYQQQYEQHHPYRPFDYIEQSRYYQNMPLVERIAPQRRFTSGQNYTAENVKSRQIGQNEKPPQFSSIPSSETVKAGESVTFEAKTTSQPVPNLSWYRSDGSCITTGGRYNVEIFNDGSTKLTINKCTADDNDTYLCVAENEGGAVQIRCSLNVVEQKSSGAPQFIGKFQSVTIYEGDSLTLYCKAVGAKLRMSWSKDGTQLKSGGSFKIEDKGNGETILQILNAKLADGGWYQCDAANESGASSLKGRVVVQTRKKLDTANQDQITLRKIDRRIARYGGKMEEDTDEEVRIFSKQPPKFLDTIKNLSLIEGQTALLSCKYSPPDDPNLKIAWLLNGKAVITSSRLSTVAENGYAALEINPVKMFDKGEYTIVAVNTLGEARQSATVNVIGHRSALADASNVTLCDRSQTNKAIRIAEMPNFHTELRSMEVFDGQHVHLEAKFSPVDDPNLKIKWFFNRKPLKQSDNIRMSNELGLIVLDILKITPAEAGSYTCQLANEVGIMESTATILVQPPIKDFEQRNIMDVEDARELRNEVHASDQVPVFLTNLSNCHCNQEFGSSYFEARIAPVNDPTLKVIWLKDGQPLPNANRIQTFYNFGCVSLTLNPTYPEDEGIYTCILKNLRGTAQSVAQLTTVDTTGLQLESKHKQSLAQIGYLEGQQVHIGPPPVERPEEFNSMEQPRFARQLESRIEINENEPVHFEARIQPASDVKMVVEWYHNGAPLPAAHRFRPMFDFGYVALDILYAFPEDSGIYTLIARNELGEVQSNLELIVNSDKSLYLDAHHPEGLDRIQELEQSRIRPLEYPADRECDHEPRFIGDLHDLELNESENIHFALKLEPTNDPTMKVTWYINGQPLLASSRVRTQYEFGFLTVDIHGTIPEDSGVYTVRAINALGEGVKECTVTIKPYATILSETQHQESLGKIHQIENLNKYGRQEVEDKGPQGPPCFVKPLPGDIGEVKEGEPLHLECQITPVNDNTLHIYWLKDGKPIPTGHRFRTFHDFRFVSLDILDVYAQDSGTYTCIAKNALGQADSSITFTCKDQERILDQTQHPNSVARIQEIEASKPAAQEVPDAVKEAPKFIKHIGTGEMMYVTEGDNVYLGAQITPVDDNSLTYEWLLNDRPLMKAHRFVLSHDFGFIVLNILYMYPEDSGTYTLIVKNASGEARSVADIDCKAKGSMITESFHPNSVQRIHELEMPLQLPDERPEAPRMAPKIVRTLPSQLNNVHESQTLHLEAQILPVDDNQLKVEWLHNGHPLKAGSRFRLMNDFGFVSLDIDYIIAEDAGQYTLLITNPEGYAETSTQFDVERLKNIYMDTEHPESLRRIQEIEAVQPAKPSEEEQVPEMPSFTQLLNGPKEILREGQSVHMDCMVQPINDPNLKIEWFLNGYPIMFGSRIRTMHDFGYVGLEFLHIHPEDSGTYTCKISNTAGKAVTEFFIECKPRRNIYLDTQHAESWVKIQEIENYEPPRESSPELSFPPPTFTVPLQNLGNVFDGESVRLECRLQPVNDPTLKVYWTRNGLPLPQGSRFMPARNLDYVTLDLLAVYGEDSGIYSCRAISEFGEATTSCTVTCEPTESLLLDTQHQESWNQIQDIENRRPQEPIYFEPEKIPPRFVVALPAHIGEFNEGEPIHLEGQIEPTNDNELTVEWYQNGQLLTNGHRFRKTHDFGYVSLDILYAFPEDSGEWTCVASNSLGDAQSTAVFNITGKKVINSESQHPESLQRIQEIEAPKEVVPEMPELKPLPPKFTQPLEIVERIEGQPAHFETRVTPINDPKMKIQWFKDGVPLLNSNRFHHTFDFGFIGYDISYTVPEDAGVYTVVATNEEGQDQLEGQLYVETKSAIIGDTQHERSWQKIRVLEQPKKKPAEAPESEHGPPHFTRQLNSNENLIEGQPAHFEAQYEPIDDPQLAILWFHNNRPLAAGSRISMRNEFGLVTLDIHYVLPEDIGEFRCLARNAVGEDQSSGSLQCQSRASILAEVQHPKSWKRIQEIEAPKAIPTAPEPTVYAKPTFTQPLKSIADVPEGGVVLLEARVIPVNDPKLQIQWFHSDAPLQQSSWHTMTNDFGCVTLRISPVYSHHSGVYSCKAVNEQGAAITSANVSVIDTGDLVIDTKHPDSLKRIQELESIVKNVRLEVPEPEFSKPNWIKAFDNIDNLEEGGIVQLIGYVEPVSDPNLKIEWYLNGAPLKNSNRYRYENDFGNVTLTIIHVLPEDSGLYTCKAVNKQGEAATSATVKVAEQVIFFSCYESIVRDTQHPVSWEKIQILETPAIIEEIEEAIEKEKPRFLTQLESATDIPEGAIVHLEATFQPARDPDLKVIWLHNGQPLGASQLVKIRSELGWAALDINGVNPDHNGVYTLKIINSEGEAASSASIKVAGIGNILLETAHEESWRRIQEIEAPKEKLPEPPPPVYDAPSIHEQISDVECGEGEPAHFEAVIAPTNDPNLQVTWFRNGQPLAHGSKYAISRDFGFCTLDIGYTYPEDQGVYQLRLTNENGEAVSSATLKCLSKEAIYGDTQHMESWKRIQELEAPKVPVPEIPPLPKTLPRFLTHIQSPGNLYEGQPAHFEATIEPIDDPDLIIQWFLNGNPISASSRIKMINDFGWVIMDISATESRDNGEWTCIVSNEVGEAKSSASINISNKEDIVLDSMQPQSLERIMEIEAGKPVLDEVPPKIFGPPQITVHLQKPLNLTEGESAHLEARFTPTDDPSLKVEWFRNTKPLFHANRYKMVQDFGFAILDILHLFVQDAGEYTVKVINSVGEASSSTVLEIASKETLLLQPQDEGKAKAIERLEYNLHLKPEEKTVEEQKTVPVFIEPLSAPVTCEEGDRIHFTARYEPLNDNQLQIQWHLNGKPLKTGSRVKTISDFGFVVLEISPSYPEDSGEYTCRAVNKVGEAVTSTQLKCNPKQKIITKSQLPDNMSGAYKKIVEIEAQKLPAPEKSELDYEAPRFLTQLESLTNLSEGQLAHLETRVEPVGDPNLRIEWFHNGQPIGHTARMKAIHDFGFVVLELIPAEPQDSGKWVCRASNKKGQAETSCDMQVKGMGGIVFDWQSTSEGKDRIEKLEEYIHRPRDELDQPVREFDAPHFTQNLIDLGQMNEAEATAFTCVLQPIGDPSLHIEWLHNGHAIPYSNRIHMSNDFGVATLLIKHLITEDSGEYKCIAYNSKGKAESIGHVEVASIIKIDAPQIIQPLVENIDGVEQGDSIHMECRVSPINDSKLTVSWLKDGKPLMEASRFKSSCEFGFVILDILYALPEDSGIYECVVENDKGKASTGTHITVLPKPSVEFAPQAPGADMENLENHLRQHTRVALALSKDDAYNETIKRPPEFKTELTNIGVEESDYCRFETQIAPINDPYMKIEWFKDGKPVLIGHRFRSILDFGFACLDVLYALPDDTGEYTCVATNPYGKATSSAKLACSDVKKLGDQPYWSEQISEQPREKQAPRFTIKPMNIQAVENEPARFECAVLGNPKPKVIWYINGNQAIHGSRYKLHYDGMYYLTISKTKISDAGEILAIAKNSEGEVLASAMLDVYQTKDFRHVKLKPTSFKTVDELHEREIQWQKEILGSLGEAFEKAPKVNQQKLMRVERSKTPTEPLESEELIEKFTRPKNEQFYNQLTYIETTRPIFESMKLEDVALKPGHIEKHEPIKEKMEQVELRAAPKVEKEAALAGASVPKPKWAIEKKLGNVESRFRRLPEQEKEIVIPARDQVKFKLAKPKPAIELPTAQRVEIQKEKAKLASVKQKPEIPKEREMPAKDQVKIKQKFQPKVVKPSEASVIESGPLKETPAVVKRKIVESIVPSKPQPIKMGQTQKIAPQISQQLTPIQAEVGHQTQFNVLFSGDEPITVKWFQNGNEIKPSFEFQINTTEKSSTLTVAKLKMDHNGQYMCRVTNIAGTQESMANLVVIPPAKHEIAPDFKQRINDIRVKQNTSSQFKCIVTGNPEPIASWFKDGKPLPNDSRYQIFYEGNERVLMISDTLPQDAGIYECVVKNSAGEARCKARLNIILAKTGKGAEVGPRLEAPRFQFQIQPVIVTEGSPAEFRANYTGSPEPMIRWYRNNEPIKKTKYFEMSQGKGEAMLRIAKCYQDDVAEYKCEATNPAGKATSVANLLLEPKGGVVMRTTAAASSSAAGEVPNNAIADNAEIRKKVPFSNAPQFTLKLLDITARPGHTAKFVAEISGNPQPTVAWQFNGKPLYDGRNHKISLIGNKAVLELQRISEAEAGDYIITIRNPLGAAQSQAKLKIQLR